MDSQTLGDDLKKLLKLTLQIRVAAGDAHMQLGHAALVQKIGEMHSAWMVAHDLLCILRCADPTGGAQRHPEFPLQIRGDDDATTTLCDTLNRLESCYECFKPEAPPNFPLSK